MTCKRDTLAKDDSCDRTVGGFHHATQNSMPLKTYGLFISGMFLEYFSIKLTQVTETTESKTMDTVFYVKVCLTSYVKN